MKKETYNKFIKKLRKEVIWTTASGYEQTIAEMETNHIQNTIIMLIARQEKCDKYKLGDYQINDMSAGEWVELFKDELTYRSKKD